jgi:plasmid stabilization system protein ParE
VKVAYRQAASDDVARQFRYYLVSVNAPQVAVRFHSAVRAGVRSLVQHPFLGPRYPVRNPQLRNLRFWPVPGFDAICIYYLVEGDTIRVIRILHGKRDVRRILERDGR